MKLIDTKHTQLLSKAMDAYSLRQKAIASNVANIDTEGYKRLTVNFEEQLQKAQGTSMSSPDTSNINAKMQETEQKPELEDEMFELTDTQIRVQLVTRALRHEFTMLKTGITGRNQ